MTLLNQADALYLGSDQVDRVYAGSKLVWRQPDPDAEALIARFTAAPTYGRKSIITDLVVELKAAGIWEGLRWLHIFAAHDAQAACLNWKTAAGGDVAVVGSPSFGVDRGFKGDGVGGYLSILSVASAPQNGANIDNFSLGVWVMDIEQSLARFGIMRSGNRTHITPRIATGAISGRINSNATLTGGAYMDKMLIGMDTAGPQQSMYINGEIFMSGAKSLNNYAVPIQYLNASGEYHDGGVMAGYASVSLDDAGHRAMYRAIERYLSAVGAISF